MPKLKDLAYGEGSISQPNAKGIRRGRVMVNGQRETVYGRTETEVRDAMAELRGTNTGEAIPLSDSPTLGDWLVEWFEEYTPDDSSANTLSNYEWAIDKWEPLHHIPLEDLEVVTIEAHLRELARGRRPLRRNSLIRARTVLAMAIDSYNGRHQITWNPARRARIPKGAKPATEKRTLTLSQARALLEAAEGDRLEVAVVLMLWLGLRPGEAAGVRWSTIDLEAGTLSITGFRRVEYDNDGRAEMSITDGAKARSDRRLALPPEAVDALRRQAKRQAREQIAAAPGVWTDSGLVVTTASGGPVDPGNLRRTVRRLAKAAGIFLEREISPYELRHTAASLLVEAGIPLEEVSDLLGHKTPRMLLEAYRHRSKRVVDKHLAVRLFA
jgi:integrase